MQKKSSTQGPLFLKNCKKMKKNKKKIKKKKFFFKKTQKIDFFEKHRYSP